MADKDVAKAREASRRWKRANPEKVRAQKRRSRAKNPPTEEQRARAREAGRRWRAKNPLTQEERAAKKERDRQYRERNIETIQARKASYREREGENLAAAQRARYRRDIESWRERRAERYWANPEAARVATRKWAEENPDKARDSARRSRKANPEGARERRRRYRARKRGVAFEAWTTVEILERDGWECQIDDCRCPGGRVIDPSAQPHSLWEGVADHIQPVSKGGEDTAANLQAAHRSCNCAKGTRWQDG